MIQNRNRTAALLAGCLLIIPLMSCEDSEKIPPDGSTITLAGNPATVVLGTTGTGSSEIIATVRSELGVPLPGQDVRFSASSGLLHFTGTTPVPANSAANLPIPTDRLGNSSVTLTTAATTTVTATSGNTTGTLTLNTSKCSVSQITLNLDNSADSLCAGTSSDLITLCSQETCFVAQAFCVSGVAADGVNVTFSLQNNTNNDGDTFNGTINPGQVITDIDGFAHTKLSIPDSNDCQTQCAGKACTAEVLAAITGGIRSDPLQLTINIPSP